MLLAEITQAVVLGVLQGLTEFLPISSSAHLIIVPWLFGWQHLGLTFDVMLHAGTLLAVLIYFYQDWWSISSQFVSRFRGQKDVSERPIDLVIALGTLPAIAVALVFQPVVEDLARKPEVTVATLTLFGFLLGWADRRGKGNLEFDGINLKVGILIGVAQSLALIPGVSRAGITITAGLLLGLSRSDAARFSFLLSGPIIALAALKGMYELLAGAEPSTVSSLPLVSGVLVSFITGVLVIKYFLRFLRSGTLLPFVVYRFLLAVVVLFWILLD